MTEFRWYMGAKPFAAYRHLGDTWALWQRTPRGAIRFVASFDSQAEAVDHAHRNWPWWP